MRRLFDHGSVLKDDDLVGLDDAGEPVGDENYGPVAGNARNRLLNQGFRLIIQGARGLIEYEDLRIADQRPSDRQTLPPPLTVEVRGRRRSCRSPAAPAR